MTGNSTVDSKLLEDEKDEYKDEEFTQKYEYEYAEGEEKVIEHIPKNFFTPREVARVLNIPVDIAHDLLKKGIEFELSEIFILAKYKERKALEFTCTMMKNFYEMYTNTLAELESKYPYIVDEYDLKPIEAPKINNPLP